MGGRCSNPAGSCLHDLLMLQMEQFCTYEIVPACMVGHEWDISAVRRVRVGHEIEHGLFLS